MTKSKKPIFKISKSLRIIFLSLALIVFLPLFLYLCLSLYAWTGPHSLPKFAHYIEDKAKSYLPENMTLKIENFEIDRDSHIVTRLLGLELQKEDLGHVKLEAIQFYLDPLGLIPNSDRKFLHVKILSPQVELEAKEKKQTKPIAKKEKEEKSEALPQIKSLLQEHKSALTKIEIELEHTTVSVKKSPKDPLVIPIESFTLQVLPVQGNLFLEMKARLPLEKKTWDSHFKFELPTKKKDLDIYAKSQVLAEEGSFKTETPNSLSKYLQDGLLTLDGSYSLPENKSEKIKVDLGLHLESLKVRYLKLLTKIPDLKIFLHWHGEKLRVEIPKTKILKDTDLAFKASVEDMESEKKFLKVEAESLGQIQDLVDMAKGYLPEKLQVKEVGGTQSTKFSANIPLGQEEMALKDMGIELNSNIGPIEASKIYKDISLNDGAINIHAKNNLMKISGLASISKRINIHLDGTWDFKTNDRRLTLKSKSEWKTLRDLGLEIPKMISGDFDLKFYHGDYAKQKNTVLTIDLGRSILAKTYGIEKKMNEEGRIIFDLNQTEGKSSTLRYSIRLGNHETQGVGLIPKGLKKEFEINFSTIRIKGPKDAVAELEFSYKGKTLHLKSKDIGSLLKFLDLTDKIGSGALDFEMTMLPEKLQGEVKLEKFQVKKVPLFLKILALGSATLSSLKGMASVVEGRGMEFSILTNSFTYMSKEKKLEIDKLKIAGNTLHGKMDGSFSFKDKTTANIDGIIVPANIINTAAKHIPFIGKKIGPPIALQFNVDGQITDPKVSVKFLSILSSESFIRIEEK